MDMDKRENSQPALATALNICYNNGRYGRDSQTMGSN